MRPLLALFLRSLRVDTRAVSTYVLRGVLVGLALYAIFMTNTAFGWAGAPGRRFFAQMLWIDLWLFFVVGLSYFASAITEEKEDDTLGLLRMTNLSALAILLGKSTARLAGALALLAVQLPFLLVAVTLGGVRVAQVLAGFVWLLGFVFLLANLGLLASVICRRTAGAALLGGVLALPFISGPQPFFGSWWARVFGLAPGGVAPFGRFFDAWHSLSASARLDDILATDFRGPIVEAHLAACAAVGTGCFLLAWLLFTPCADRAAPESRGRAATATGAVRRHRARRPAIAWRDGVFLHGGRLGVAVKALLTLLALGLGALPTIPFGTRSDRYEFHVFFTTWWVGLFTLLTLAFDASRIFKHERREQTLASLALLPLEARQIVWQKVRGALLSAWPLLLAALVCVVLVGQIAIGEWVRHPPVGEPLFYLASAGVFALGTALLLPVFVAWLSLRLRWGAFPVGVMVWFFANWIAGGLCVLAFREASIVVLALAALGSVLGLAMAIPARLARLAAEE
jgi:ABC-type transport system involved in multi-copper enzyme maturation permease subunit